MTKVFIFITIFIVIVLLGVGFQIVRNSVSATITDKVLKTERVQYCSSSGCDSRYLIYGQKETYEDTDSLFFLKFNSSDVYGQIQDGKTYTFTVVGWRIPFFSWYRNIIVVK